MFNDEMRFKAFELLAICRNKNIKLAAAESCTGGLLTALLTEIPGSADVVERGFVTYSNEAKTEMLGVSPSQIETHGAVSHEVAESMARGALLHSKADVVVSITGIAGPTGGSEHKPVGLVYIGLANRDGIIVDRNYFHGTRGSIREQTVLKAITLIRHSLSPSSVYVV